MSKYEIIIFRSKTDEAFIAEMPELNGCIAHSETQEEALHEVNAVIREWPKLTAEKGWNIPEPKGRPMFA